MAVESYSVLDVEYKPLSKVDRGHTVTIVIKDEENRSRDELYIDGYHIHPSNWNYNSKCRKTDRSVLRYTQQPNARQKVYLSGMLAFDAKRNVGRGTMNFGKVKRGIDLARIPGNSAALAIVGSYNLKDFGDIQIHPKGLVINDKRVESFNVTRNRASWKGSNKSGCINQDGFLEFSDDGRHVIKSSFGAVGSKQLSKSSNGTSSELSVKELLNMDPFDGDGNDTVQQAAMNDFYLLIQYYMRDDWRESFLSKDPIELQPYLQDIAFDDGAGGGDGKNKDYYQSMSVPYLTYALSGVDHEDVGKLNKIRADKKLKKLMKDSDVEVYNRHSGKLYSYHWNDILHIEKYWNDQEQTDYTTAIDDTRDKWKNEVLKDVRNALGDGKVKNISDMIDEFAQTAKDNKVYWAFALLYSLSDADYLNNLEFIITSTVSMLDDVQREQERFCSVMTVLDPSNYFTDQYAMILQVFKLTVVIPKEIDISNLEDLDFFAAKIMEQFVTMYQDDPDKAIADAVKSIEETAKEYGWEDMMDKFTASAKAAMSWPRFFKDVSSRYFKAFGEGSIKASEVLGMVAFSVTLGYFALGKVSFSDLDELEKAEFITSCVRGTAFFFKLGADFVLFAPRMWESCKTIFYKTRAAITEASTTATSALAKWIIKSGSAKINQALKVIEGLGDNLIAKTFTRFKKVAGKLTNFISTRVAGVLALAGVIFSALDLAHSHTPLEYAMNSMFLLSSILEVVAISAQIAISVGITTIGGSIIGPLALTTIASVVGGLAIVAAVVGVILMLVSLFVHPKVPDPIEDFVKGDEVKDEGLYMEFETTIEYFAVQMDDAEESKEIGVTFTTDGSNYMHVDTDGKITFTAIDRSYNTVFTIAVDDAGITTIFTKAINGDDETILHLTVNDNNSVDMQRKFADDEERKKQLWIVDITGNVVKTGDKKDQLKSATFTIYNQKKNVYVRSDGSTISVGSSSQDWTIALETMKSDYLQMRDISFDRRCKNRTFNSYLAQSGSTSGRKFTLVPSLPEDKFEFDEKIGAIKQLDGVTPPAMPPTTYTLSVTSPYGQGKFTSVNFTMEIFMPN